MIKSIEDHQWFVDLAQSGYYKNVGEESKKTWLDKANNKGNISFWQKYTKGRHGTGLDIGYAGYLDNVVPILPSATGIDLNTPNYNGRNLPFPDGSQDYVYSSHFLEHVSNYKQAIQEQFRVTKKGGFIIIVVPHRDLYEKSLTLPSRFNADHKRLYTASSLLKESFDHSDKMYKLVPLLLELQPDD